MGKPLVRFCEGQGINRALKASAYSNCIMTFTSFWFFGFTLQVIFLYHRNLQIKRGFFCSPDLYIFFRALACTPFPGNGTSLPGQRKKLASPSRNFSYYNLSKSNNKIQLPHGLEATRNFLNRIRDS